MSQLKAYLLCHHALANPLYNSWCAEVDCEVVDDYDQSWEPPADCGVIVSHLHYDFPTAAILKRLSKENKFPVLVLADGVLEFRNTFSNPGVAPGSLFMPVHGHRIACLSQSQARHIESWGNDGKTEVVGLPRLDALRGQHPENQTDGVKKILVVTARQPGFTDQQLDLVQKSLVDVRDWFAANRTSNGAAIEPVWRLTGDLNERVGVAQDPQELEVPISEVLKTVSAVISTPSTIVLESMLMDLPTAVLDYTNSPKFVSAAWNISAREHLDSTISDLVNPSESRRLFQRGTLSDALQINESATDRMIRLVNGMIDCRRQAIETNGDLEMPKSILGDSSKDSKRVFESSEGVAEKEESRNEVSPQSLADLFPCQVGFRMNELEELTTQYDQLCRSVSSLQDKLDALRADHAIARQQVRIAWRHHDYVSDQVKWLRAEIQRLNLALRISRRPTRLHRRLRVRASIAFLRWQFFVDEMEKSASRNSMPCQLEQLFELTAYPKGNKIPATIRNFQTNPRGKPRIKMWKYRPTNSLLEKMSRSVNLENRRLEARRVMRAI